MPSGAQDALRPFIPASLAAMLPAALGFAQAVARSGEGAEGPGPTGFATVAFPVIWLLLKPGPLPALALAGMEVLLAVRTGQSLAAAGGLGADPGAAARLALHVLAVVLLGVGWIQYRKARAQAPEVA